MGDIALVRTNGETQVDVSDRLYPRIAGSLIGAAAGDALGWITEFVRGVDHLQKLYRTKFVTDYRPWQKTTGGRFNAYIDYISKGEYSDDTQLALATARSLRADGSVDAQHFASRELPLWLGYARGGGRTVTAAARVLRRKSSAWNANFFVVTSRGEVSDYRDAGANGVAMRIGPIALANARQPAIMELGVWRNAISTHGHPRAIIGALVHAEAVRQCLIARTFAPHHLIEHLTHYVEELLPPTDSDISVWLRAWDSAPGRSFESTWESTRREMLQGLRSLAQPEGANWKTALERFGCLRQATKGSGTGTVLGALAIFYELGGQPAHAVVTAVNQIGSDTDTIAGFVGGLCGAVHGYDSIPRTWAGELQDYEYFMRVASELTAIAVGRGIGGTALLPAPHREFRDLRDLSTLLKEHSVNAKDVVYHPLFGRGVVESVEAQALRRKDGAKAVFAWVRFYIGQSCKFRYIELGRRTNKASNSKTAVHDDLDDI